MFDPRSFATGGLYPGLVTTRSVANLGAYEVQIIIEPVIPAGGGGVGPSDVLPRNRKDKYKVKIIVSRNGKTWKYETIVSSVTASVVARLGRVLARQPEVVVENVVTRVASTEEPVIKVIKK